MTDTAVDLIERLEKADAGSLELDGRIYCAVRGLKFHMWDGAGLVIREPEFKHIPHDHVRPYTVSMDDALKLIRHHMAHVGRHCYEIHLREVDGEWVFFEITIPSYEFQGRSRRSIALAACQAWARVAEHDRARLPDRSE